MQITVNMHQAKTELSKLVAKAWEGHEVLISRNGKVVAKLVPFITEPRVLGQARGTVWISPDFDDPLPDDILKAFYGLEPDEEWPDSLKEEGGPSGQKGPDEH